MGAGKSSLVLRFVKGQFFEYQESTIGAAFLTQTVATSDVTVKFEIWDTAGQERYHSLAPMYTAARRRPSSLRHHVADVLRAQDVGARAAAAGNANLVTLAGNKSDAGEMRQVSVEGRAREENGLHFVETSAKTAASVNDLFCDVARKLPRDAPAVASAPGVVLDARRSEKPKSQCC